MLKRVGRGGLETLLTVLAVVWLAWRGWGFGQPDFLAETDDRYRRDVELGVELTGEAARTGWVRHICNGFYDGLPDDAARICNAYRTPTGWAKLREKLAGPSQAEQGPRPAKAIVAETPGQVREALKNLQLAHDGLARDFFRPLAATKGQYDAWQEKASLGFPGEDWEDSVKNLLDQTQTYRDTYRLDIRGDTAYPRPFECAWSYLSRRAGANPPGETAGPLAALVGLAGLLDGNGGRLPVSAFPSGQDWSDSEARNGCRELGSPLEAAQTGADLIRMARGSDGNAAKAAAALDLLTKAWWQLAVWAFTGLLVVKLSRRVTRPQRALFVALMLWALAAAITRPYLEWLGAGSALSALSGGWKLPLWLAGAAVAVLFLPLPSKHPLPATVPSSAAGYPGFVLFVGLGWLILLDLSVNGYSDNRFHALYQQAYLFAAFVTVSVLSLLRAPLARWGLRALSWWPLRAAGRPSRTLLWSALGALAAGVLLVAVVATLRSHRQMTSEMFRVPLILGLSWFLLARADVLALPWLRQPGLRNKDWGRRLRWTLWLSITRLKLAFPLLLLLACVVAGLRLTDDNGPLLVILYGGSLFVGAGVGVLCAEKLGWRVGLSLGMALVPLYVWAGSFALLRYGRYLGARIRARLESADQPFLAGNDQMAHVLWFQEAANEAGGFGFGAAPWCGELTGACRGVPMQIQSDYMFTALIGVFGPWSWLWLALFALWLWRLARSHPAATSGRVEADDLGQAWLSWITLCWVGLTLTQLAVTVAGNQGWLPLTGITFPFLSYGFWSLLANALFLAMALNLNRRAS
jgi:cell division protein FtsW (lipid II flippase)